MTNPAQDEHAQTEALRLAKIIRDWCSDCRIPLPSDDECARLVAALTATPAQPVAQQGAAYAELPEPDSYLFQHEDTGLTQYVDSQQVEWGFEKNNPRCKRCDGAFSTSQMRAFADATHTLRAESLAAAYREELDKFSQRNYELLLATHGRALRLLTQKEKDSLGRRAEGMDGNEWDQWVQEKFAQVNGLKVQGGSYEWEWE